MKGRIPGGLRGAVPAPTRSALLGREALPALLPAPSCLDSPVSRRIPPRPRAVLSSGPHLSEGLPSAKLAALPCAPPTPAAQHLGSLQGGSEEPWDHRRTPGVCSSQTHHPSCECCRCSCPNLPHTPCPSWSSPPHEPQVPCLPSKCGIQTSAETQCSSRAGLGPWEPVCAAAVAVIHTLV